MRLILFRNSNTLVKNLNCNIFAIATYSDAHLLSVAIFKCIGNYIAKSNKKQIRIS